MYRVAPVRHHNQTAKGATKGREIEAVAKLGDEQVARGNGVAAGQNAHSPRRGGSVNRINRNSVDRRDAADLRKNLSVFMVRRRSISVRLVFSWGNSTPESESKMDEFKKFDVFTRRSPALPISRTMGKLEAEKGSPASGWRVSEGAYCSCPVIRPFLPRRQRPHRPITTPPRRGRLVSSKTAAEYLSVSPNTIRKYVAEGKLPAFLIGNKLVKFDLAVLDHFLASRRVDNS